MIQPTTFSTSVVAPRSDSMILGLNQQLNLLPSHVLFAFCHPGFQPLLLFPPPPQTLSSGVLEYFSPALATQRVSAIQTQACTDVSLVLSAQKQLSAEHTPFDLKCDRGDSNGNGVAVHQGRRERARSYSALHAMTLPCS